MSHLTKTFPPHIKPVHVGAYKVPAVPGSRPGQVKSGKGFAWWDGSAWGIVGGNPHVARAMYLRMGTAHANQDKPWRGLAQEPRS